MIFFLKLINYLLVTNVAYTQIEGCTDIEAYNCEADSVWSTYIFDVGGIMYDNSCNWDWDINSNEAIYIGECEVDPCDGYFNEQADNDDGSCRYYQSPDFDIIYSDNGIDLDWSDFTPPTNSDLESFHVQKCSDQCSWMPGFSLTDSNTETYITDIFDWQDYEYIKYAIFVKYSSNPYWGWAINTKVIIPTEGCTDPEAINYNEDANIDDDSCILDIDRDIIPNSFKINSIYPNPFNPLLNIIYEVSYPQSLKLNIYNINGQLIESIDIKNSFVGEKHYIWEPKNYSSSIFLVSLDNGKEKLIQKVVLLK